MNNIEMLDEEDVDGSEERDATSMVLADLANTLKAMRKKRLSKPVAEVKVMKVGDSAESAEAEPLAADGELTEDELASLEALC